MYFSEQLFDFVEYLFYIFSNELLSERMAGETVIQIMVLQVCYSTYYNVQCVKNEIFSI